MITFEMKNEKFTVLNLTDFQLSAEEWTKSTAGGKIILDEIDALINKNKPDLITISGDIAWSGDYEAQRAMSGVINSYKIPWAVVFGNHDHDGGIDKLDKAIEIYREFDYFTYENGEDELGRGNYIINIAKGEKIVHSIFMMDTHDRYPYVDRNGKTDTSWAKLMPNQIEWYKKEVKKLKALGAPESSIIIHIPIYAYNYAWECAHNKSYNEKEISPKDSYDKKYWNEGYSDSFGVKYEPISSYGTDDGVFEEIKALDHTKNIISGHNHINNYSINYKGVRLSFALKTGIGSYYHPDINGGSILTIDKDGKATFKHDFFDIKDYL